MKSIYRFIKQLFLITLIILPIFSFVSCTENPDVELRLNIDDNFYWANGTYEDTIDDAQNYEYKKLERMGYKNIMDLVGGEGKYVWLKAEFTLPDGLKNDDLSMVIPYLHFAEELYLNGKYIDDYGTMGVDAADPEIQEAGYNAHLFDFPEDFLNQDGPNVIHIKVFALGSASIVDGVFVTTRRDGWISYDNQNFWRSRIYVFFEGGMFICGLFFIMLFLAFRHEKSYLRFAILNFLSIVFFSNFFINDLPWTGFHGGVPYVWYFKIAKCVCFSIMLAEFNAFTLGYIGIKSPIVDKIIRYGTASVCSLLVICAPDFYTLSKYCLWPVLPLSAYNFIVPIAVAAFSLRKEECRPKAKIMLLAITPLFLCIFADFILKSFVMDIKLPYFSLIGWILFIVIVFIHFSLSYSKIAGRLEYLNEGLEKEIKNQTEKLSAVNQKLEHDKNLSQKDMKMAAIVQSKFFNPPTEPLKKWDFAVCYEPLSIVSGDLYNFFHRDGSLRGVTLFDASGHGVAASLVTMLAEHIIQQVYNEYYDSVDNVADGLRIINKRFIAAKGDIENYLTGLLCTITENDDGSCKVSLANAGHPNPLLYNSEEDEVEELLPSPDMPYTGPIGLRDFEIEYSGQHFEMKKGDILLLYTDGLTDTMSEGVEFNLSRVMKILKSHSKESAEDIKKHLVKKLDEFMAGNPRTDDISVIILKRTE